MNLPKSRKEALAQGSKHYFTGVPCKRGHLRERNSLGGTCVSCSTENSYVFRKTPKGRESVRRFKSKQRYKELHKRSHDLWRKTPNGRAFVKKQRFMRRKRHRAATPQWCDAGVLKQFVANCPEGCHVDHILPLSGEIVCGLNILENLQYLPAQENLSKKNKIDPLTLEANVCVLPAYREYVAPGSSGF